ncbi:MAG: dTDP-4-keto-6-deoxy-D-glucose epimerase [Eubacteriaceae bacterium]|nr:dTDP-4-keto-6-deoxy-D-glucose epimerase [Eubacteriaceae bacterium]
MRMQETIISGVFLLENDPVADDRGRFVKTFSKSAFFRRDLCDVFRESYYSLSRKDVIRGMHFQLPPYDHHKLVYVPHGKITDVLLDLRINSGSYGRCLETELSQENGRSLYIPSGVAHGFKTIGEETLTVYLVSTEYHKDYDAGIRWDSFGYDWKLENPVISERDRAFQGFQDFVSPF